MPTDPNPYTALIKLMQAAFRSDGELRVFAGLRLGKPLDRITTASNIDQKAFEIVDSMESEGKLEDLAKALREHFPKRQDVKEVVAMFPGLVAPLPSEPGAAPPLPTRLTKTQFVIDRAEIWSHLERMHRGEEPNVLVVTGAARMGKSFVADLLAHFANRRVQKYVQVPFAEIRWQPDPITLAQSWLKRMALAETTALRKDPTNPGREALDAADTLLGAFRGIQEAWWVLFDGPDSVVDDKGNVIQPPIPQMLVEFLDMVANNVATSHPNIRLVLTGIDANLLRNARRASVEQLPEISLDHVKQLFERICKEDQQPATAGVLDEVAKRVWESVPAQALDRMSELNSAVRKSLDRLTSPGGVS